MNCCVLGWYFFDVCVFYTQTDPGCQMNCCVLGWYFFLCCLGCLQLWQLSLPMMHDQMRHSVGTNELQKLASFFSSSSWMSSRLIISGLCSFLVAFLSDRSRTVLPGETFSATLPFTMKRAVVSAVSSSLLSLALWSHAFALLLQFLVI